jgi:two-component system response regulator QseB
VGIRVLLLEDDLPLGQSLHNVFLQKGLEVVWVRTLSEGRRHATEGVFDVAVLDLTLPDGDGLVLLTELRSGGLQIPVLILSARETVEDRITGLRTGADDYLPKPFATGELLARLDALVRRAANQTAPEWRVGELVIDVERRLVWRNGVPVDLSAREFDLLLILAQRAGKVVTRARIETRLYGEEGGSGNVLDVHVHHLRRKLGDTAVKTVRGVGFLLTE